MGACLTWLLDHKRPFYLCGDKGYPLLLWLMTLHKEKWEVHSILELLYYHKHKKGRLVVENAFGIMKQTFMMIFLNVELHTTIVFDTFSTCCLLHNLVLGSKK